uniref:Uncharacterized protein n=1 Tax=Oryza sativa subsp. japonica TaxID=39947 RepID=Q67IY1_ORYSJ|nr:hypothetical protein [Oryza sativa Japonica Group]
MLYFWRERFIASLRSAVAMQQTKPVLTKEYTTHSKNQTDKQEENYQENRKQSVDEFCTHSHPFVSFPSSSTSLFCCAKELAGKEPPATTAGICCTSPLADTVLSSSTVGLWCSPELTGDDTPTANTGFCSATSHIDEVSPSASVEGEATELGDEVLPSTTKGFCSI